MADVRRMILLDDLRRTGRKATNAVMKPLEHAGSKGYMNSSKEIKVLVTFWAPAKRESSALLNTRVVWPYLDC